MNEQFIIYDPATGEEVARGFGPVGTGEIQAGAWERPVEAVSVPVGTWRDGTPTNLEAIRSAILTKAERNLSEQALAGIKQALSRARDLTAIYKAGRLRNG